MKKPLVIAIDGPSASGKGTLAAKVAAHFGFAYLNTGAIYRLVALRVIEQTPQQVRGDNFELIDERISELTKNISEKDLNNSELFSEEVGAVASRIAKNKKLRSSIFDFQKQFVENGKKEKGGCVLEGRDTTTVIAPDADFKFFINCDVEIRAQRRFKQLKNSSYEEILQQLKKRDESDINRKESPLKIAAGAHIIDNGVLSIEEAVAKIIEIVSS
jgi:cytidylate kinase